MRACVMASRCSRSLSSGVASWRVIMMGTPCLLNRGFIRMGYLPAVVRGALLELL